MSVWEYKVITSGKGGFATPALLESFLNQLGRDEWEILSFRQQPDNPLAFTGLARRPTQRDWTLEDAVSAAARTEADKLRAEFEAKFKGANAPAEEKAEGADKDEQPASEEEYRKVRDTERDLDPDAPEDEEDEWDKLKEGDELPTFFEAIRPHLRRNQRGPGMSVGVEHLARRWELTEDEVIGALKECGFTIPEDEDEKPACVEYEGDLYWVNVNRRGERWINTKEKPRPMFRVVKAAPAEEPAAGEEKAEGHAPAEAGAEEGRQPRRHEKRHREHEARNQEPLPAGEALLERIRPMMRRSRRGPGGSGSMSFLSRALKCSEADLAAAFAGLGLTGPPAPGEKPVFVEIGDRLWWLNQDQRGGTWINERNKSEPAGPEEGQAGESPKQETPPGGAPAEAAQPGVSPLTALRLLLKKTKTGSHSGETGHLAATLGKSTEELLAALTGAGLQIPEKPRARPVFVEHAGEIFWLNKNTKGELWLNAKASKYSGRGSHEGEAVGESPGGGGGEAGGEVGDTGKAPGSEPGAVPEAPVATEPAAPAGPSAEAGSSG
jgi:hypothetical protein